MPSEVKQSYKGHDSRVLRLSGEQDSISVIRTHDIEAGDMAYLRNYLPCKHEVISLNLRTFHKVRFGGVYLESLYWVDHLTRSKSASYPTY